MKKNNKQIAVALAIAGALAVALTAVFVLGSDTPEFQSHLAARAAYHAEGSGRSAHGGFTALLLVAAGAFFVKYRRGGAHEASGDPLTALAGLYGSGTITREEFLERKAVLEEEWS